LGAVTSVVPGTENRLIGQYEVRLFADDHMHMFAWAGQVMWSPLAEPVGPLDQGYWLAYSRLGWMIEQYLRARDCAEIRYTLPAGSNLRIVYGNLDIVQFWRRDNDIFVRYAPHAHTLMQSIHSDDCIPPAGATLARLEPYWVSAYTRKPIERMAEVVACV
jgi:hypothetical protein